MKSFVQSPACFPSKIFYRYLFDAPNLLHKFQMDKENVVCIKLMVLPDPQKAPDTVNHSILLGKLDRPKQWRGEMVPHICLVGNNL